jgi:hypothetical protein
MDGFIQQFQQLQQLGLFTYQILFKLMLLLFLWLDLKLAIILFARLTILVFV